MLDDLTWEQAQEKEREFIKLCGRKDLGLGTLVNKTDGGEGTVGCIQSEEHKAKRSAALTGRKQTEEHRKNNSIAQIGYKQSKETIAKRSAALTGRTLSEEWKAKIGAAVKARWSKKRIENGNI